MRISDWSSDVCSSDLEYSLFAAKAKNISDLDKVIEQIEAFRELDDAQRKEIVRLLDAYQIGGTKRGSLLNTVRLGRSYAMRMWQLSDIFDVGSDHCLLLKTEVDRKSVV